MKWEVKVRLNVLVAEIMVIVAYFENNFDGFTFFE